MGYVLSLLQFLKTAEQFPQSTAWLAQTPVWKTSAWKGKRGESLSLMNGTKHLCSLNVTINPINAINPWEREGESTNCWRWDKAKEILKGEEKKKKRKKKERLSCYSCFCGMRCHSHTALWLSHGCHCQRETPYIVRESHLLVSKRSPYTYLKSGMPEKPANFHF